MPDATWWVQGLFAAAVSGLALIVGHWVARRNFRENLVKEVRKDEKTSQQTDNEFYLRAFRGIQEEAEKLRRELRDRIDELEREIADLRAEVESSRQERELIHQEYVRLRTAHEELLVEHAELRMAHLSLKQQHENLKLSVRKHPPEQG